MRTSEHISSHVLADIDQQHASIADEAEALLRTAQRLYNRLPSETGTLTDTQREAFYAGIEMVEEQHCAFPCARSQNMAGRLRTLRQDFSPASSASRRF
jgi:hypothetical protein